MTVELQGHELVALSRSSLSALRSALLRDAAEGQAAAVFQEAGYAGGAGIYEAFRTWLSGRGDPQPEALDTETFRARAAGFFSECGWGTLEVGVLGDAVLTLDAGDWSEADPAMQAPHPSCFYSAGMFSDFFSRMGGDSLGAFEVECRSSGAGRCRFLLGSPEILQHVYNRMVEGVGYDEALQEA